MKSNRLFITLAIVGIAASSVCGRGQDNQENQSNAEDLKALRKKIEELERKVKQLEQQPAPAPAAPAVKPQQVEDLEQKVKILERNRELEQEAAETKAKEAPKISLGDKGFSFATADGSFGVQLKGLIQADSRTFIHDSGIVGNDSLLLRRARPILQGTLFSDIDFLFVPDFGGTSGPQIFDAYINYRLKPEIQLRAGKFKSPVGLEVLQTDQNILFNERSIVSSLVPSRDIGFMLHGELFGGVVSYAAGIFNGVGDGRVSSNADFDDNKEFAGRIFFQPFLKSAHSPLAGLGFGLGGSYTDYQTTNAAGLPATTGGTLGGYVTDGQQQYFAYNPTNGVVFADGEHWRLSPQGYYYYGPFGLFGEYVISSQKVRHAGAAPLRSATLEHTGWEVTALWNLTGEDALYDKPMTPRRPFSLSGGGWGAWQLVARYAEVDLDNAAFPVFANPRTSASHVSSWSVGLNWWVNRNLRFDASFSHADFEGGGGLGASAPASVTRRNEDVVFTRMQLAF
jgi:phosphate-selective porin OprO/OprP